jgi:hypothetical protein
MNRMQHAAQCLAGASSPLDELIPALAGLIHAKRLYANQAESELDDDQRDEVELFSRWRWRCSARRWRLCTRA